MTHNDLATFVDTWGYCPHKDTALIEDMCDECHNDPSQRSFYMSELLELNHERQVAVFGWCSCEDGEQAYLDCPS